MLYAGLGKRDRCTMLARAEDMSIRKFFVILITPAKRHSENKEKGASIKGTQVISCPNCWRSLSLKGTATLSSKSAPNAMQDRGSEENPG